MSGRVWVRLLLPMCLATATLGCLVHAQSAIAAETARDLKAPVDLRLDATTTNGADTHITWSWGDKNRREDGFLVEVKHGDGEWSTLPAEFPPTDERQSINFRLVTGDTYYFRVRAFDESELSYSDYSPILTVVAGTTQPTPPGKHPDLSVPAMSIRAVNGTFKGQKVVNLIVTFTVTNSGEKNAPKTHLGAYLSADAVLDPKEQANPLAKIGIPALKIKPAKKRSKEKEYTIPLTPKQYQSLRGQYLILVADWDNKAEEKSEDNNANKLEIP